MAYFVELTYEIHTQINEPAFLKILRLHLGKIIQSNTTLGQPMVYNVSGEKLKFQIIMQLKSIELVEIFENQWKKATETDFAVYGPKDVTMKIQVLKMMTEFIL